GTRARGLLLFAFALYAYWSSGMDQAERCLDPESRRLREVRLGDAATLVLLTYLGRRAVGQGAVMLASGGESAAAAAVAEVVVAALVGLAAAVYLARRARAGAEPRWRRGVALSVGAALALIAGGAAVARGLTMSPALAAAALLILCEELVFRGVLQRGLEQRWAVTAGRHRGPAAAALLATVVG